MPKRFLPVLLAAWMLPGVILAEIGYHHLLKTSQVWAFAQPVYAQVRIVPTGARGLGSPPDGRPPREVYDWNGPWAKYLRFKIFVTYNEGHGLTPKAYDFVQPNVGLSGMDNGQGRNDEESHLEGIWLFEGPSTPADIRVEWSPIEQTPDLDKEYKAAALSSEREGLAWDVYLRFRETKPGYVKPAKP